MNEAGGLAREPRRDPAANGADRSGSGRAERSRVAGVSPDGVHLGRVMSVAGAIIWGMLEPEAASAAEIGQVVRLQGTVGRSFGIITTLRSDGRRGTEDDRRLIEIRLIGEILDKNSNRWRFQRGVSSHPALDSPIHAASREELCAIYARPEVSTIRLGTLRNAADLPAFAITDNLLGKHFAVLGTTGAGKSCAVTVILRAILDAHPFGHVIMLDPHNEYAAAFGNRAELLNPSNLKLPYWLLNFEEIAHVLIGTQSGEHTYAQSQILKDAILHVKKQFAGASAEDGLLTVDTPVPYRLSDLTAALKEGMGMLNKSERTSSPYLSLIARTESLRIDKRYAFMFSSIAVRDTMRQVLAQLLRIPVEGKPITIIDISGVPSEIVDVVVSVLFRLMFELAIWSERGAAPPMLLVCEEAHRYVPQEDGAGFAPTKRVISRIAKEGRKYGITLCLVSQRPSELSMTSLSQCNTVFALRLSNEHDQAFVARALSENARWLVDSLPSLNTQEAVVVGDGVTVPVHIRFKDLKREHRPSSFDRSFSAAWRAEADPQFLDRTIDRWRRQAR